MIFRRLRRQEQTKETFQKESDRRAYNAMVDFLIEQLKLERERQKIARAYTDDPSEWLDKVPVIGRATVITGLPDTGKTNLAHVLAQIVIAWGWIILSNIGLEDGAIYPNYFYFNTESGLNKLLKKKQPKLILFDDAAMYVSSRRSGSKPSEFFRRLHVKARKPVPGDKTIPGCAIVWLSQDLEIINIDFRSRFAAWILHKPSTEIYQAEKIAAKKGKVPLAIKKVVWAYYLTINKDGKRKRRLIWWTDKLGPSKIPYDTTDLGKFYMDAEVKEGDLIPDQEATISPILQGETFKDYAYRILKDKDRRDAEVLKLCIEGIPQDKIAAAVGISQAVVSRTLNRLGTEIIGYLGEAFERGLVGQDPRQANQPGADLETDKEIISIKYRLSFRASETVYPERDLKPEIERSLETGKPLILIAYHIKYQKRIRVPLDAKNLPRVITLNYAKGTYKE